MRAMRWTIVALEIGCVLLPRAAGAQQPGLGGAVELVDPKVLRVCADPNNLPFSNEANEGFENKIAALVGEKLGKPVAYTYYPQVIGFVRVTLNAFRCDVVIGDSEGDDLVQTTNPYYHAFYALVVPPGHDLDDVDSLSDPRLKGRHLGIVARTPPATIMAENGLIGDARSYALTVDTRYEAPARTMVEDIAAGRIDGGVLWGPIAGYYAARSEPRLNVVPLLKERDAPMDFRIAMGVRKTDQNWKRTLNRLIAENQDGINKILLEYGVPIVDDNGNPIKP
jgi:quinoprotein dehydrogenase-associated probable ABC transporter substrate-binding protein